MSYQLTIEPISQTIDIEEDKTALGACLRTGVWFPHAMRPWPLRDLQGAGARR